MIKNPKIGADPEVFLYDAEDDIYVPSIGLVGGTKVNPKPMNADGFFVQEDNVMAEFNIPPCTKAEDFVAAINYSLDYIDEITPKPLSIKIVSTAEFKDDFLDCEQACISGCDPYSNAWKNGDIEEAIDYQETNKRHSGAHIHIGYDNPNEELSMRLIRNLDLLLAIPSIVIDPDKERRQSYGKAGAYREKEYGVEYRSLSNFWLTNDKLKAWVFNNTMKAIERTNNGDEAPVGVASIVNASKKDEAQKVIDKYKINMP